MRGELYYIRNNQGHVSVMDAKNYIRLLTNIAGNQPVFDGVESFQVDTINIDQVSAEATRAMLGEILAARAVRKKAKP